MCTRDCIKTYVLLVAVVSMFAVSQAWAHCGACGVGAPAKDKASCGTGGCPVKDKASCGAGGCPVTGAASDCAAGACPVAGADESTVPTINPAGLKALLDAKVPVTVLDARSGKYDDGLRIPGAKSLSPKATDGEIAKAVRSKKGLVVVYCANLKCPASAQLAKLLGGKGYASVVELPEGIEGWKAAGYPTSKAR